MALDELHARRLATVAKMFEAAMDRMELVLRSAQEGDACGESSPITAEQARVIRDTMTRIRSRLREGLGRFAVQLEKPEPKQMLAAELSTLWVILENARPERMKGYGREFKPEDKAEWDKLIQALLHETEMIRRIILKGKGKV